MTSKSRKGLLLLTKFSTFSHLTLLFHILRHENKKKRLLHSFFSLCNSPFLAETVVLKECFRYAEIGEQFTRLPIEVVERHLV